MRYSTAMMSAKDKRIKLMTEILQGVKSLKFSALERFFARRIALHRDQELKNLKGLYRLVLIVSWNELQHGRTLADRQTDIKTFRQTVI